MLMFHRHKCFIYFISVLFTSETFKQTIKWSVQLDGLLVVNMGGKEVLVVDD